jgi:hypothetical protein
MNRTGLPDCQVILPAGAEEPERETPTGVRREHCLKSLQQWMARLCGHAPLSEDNGNSTRTGSLMSRPALPGLVTTSKAELNPFSRVQALQFPSSSY